MTRSASSGTTQTWAAGQQNQTFSIYFNHNSTSFISHDIQVDNDFFRIMAFNLGTGESVTIEQVTGDGAYISDYAPIDNAVQLTPQRTSYVIERPGRYRMRLNAALGHVLVVGFRYAMENESTQDIVDSINNLANQFPLPLTVCTTNTVSPDITGNILRENVIVSPNTGNILTALPNGLYVPNSTSTPTACEIGGVVPAGAFTPGSGDFNGLGNVIAKNISGCLEENQFISSASGNLLQLRSDGAYYGISPPPNFANQYVASAAHGGNDSNLGTPTSPLLTVQKAIFNLPDGTAGNVYLYAGDKFQSYPGASTDIITGLTQQTALDSVLQIGNREITIMPWYSTGTAGDDAAVTAINNYNIAHGTGYDSFVAQQTNWPIFNFTVAQSSDTGVYVPLTIELGNSGSIIFYAITISIAQISTSNPPYLTAGLFGKGSIEFHGGNLVLSNIPMLGWGGNSESIRLYDCLISDHSTPSTPLLFCNTVQNFIFNTQPVSAGGALIVPSLSYTSQPDNAESFLTPSTMWPNIVVYSTANRAFRNVVTSIAIT